MSMFQLIVTFVVILLQTQEKTLMSKYCDVFTKEKDGTSSI